MKKVFSMFFFCIVFSLVFTGSQPNSMFTIALSQSDMMPENFKALVTATKLNLRQGPSTQSPSIALINQGDTVHIYGQISDWYLIFHPDKNMVGMVFGDYIDKLSIQNEPKKEEESSLPATSLPETSPSPGSQSEPVPISKVETLTPTPEESELLELVNQAREMANLDPLAFQTPLLRSARLKSRDMVQKNYFSHQSPTYGSPFDMLRSFQISFKSAGENIAGNPSIKRAFDDWMSSQSHRDNILNPNFISIGIGIENSPIYGKILVQQFIQ
jgi:uncharacterized YkwD family protein